MEFDRTLHDLALMMPCDFCRAKATQWCLTMPNRQLATDLHETRMRPIREAYAKGYIDAEADYKARP